MRTDEKVFVDRLRSLARIENPDVVRQELEGAYAEDLAEGIQRLEVEEGLAIIRQLDPETAAYVLIELPTESARALINELPDATVAHYLDILPMDDAIELREELDPERFEALLHAIPSEDAQEIRRLLSYPEDSAGQLMTEDFFEVGPDATMNDVLAIIRETPDEEYETVNDIYVVDSHRHLLGVFSLKQAIRSNPSLKASDIMETDIITVSPEADGEEVSRQIARYGFYAMPVLDERGRMLGIVTVDDAQSVLTDAETEDALMMGGVTGDAEAYLSQSPLELFRRRIGWLMALFLAETLTGNVMRHYGQGSSNELNLSPLTFFIPLLIGAGGNSGSQVTTTITRALALGEVRTSDVFTVMKREFVTALMVGTVLGVIGFLRAYLPYVGWGTSLDLSIVVGLALPTIVLWSTAIGSMLPLAAKRMGADPALMSAPFIATFVDATGLVIYFEIARAIIHK
ncbi:MAG: magnesium transporter [Fimbriimonas sp.]